MKLKTILLAMLALTLLASAAWGATDTKTLNISAPIASRAKMTMADTTVTFPDSDPDTTPSVADSNSPHSLTCSARTGAASAVTLTCLAAGDLADGSKNIAISNVTWTATGGGYVTPGTMNKTTAQSMGSWTGSGSRTGTLSFAFANSWNYETGNYAQTAGMTLTAP